MTLLTPTLLENLGINLSEEHYQALAEHFETTLNERVINEIVLELSPEQAEQLSNLQQSSDQEIMTWLKVNVPDFSDIVVDEIDILLGEIAENSEAISDN